MFGADWVALFARAFETDYFFRSFNSTFANLLNETDFSEYIWLLEEEDIKLAALRVD